MPANLAEVHIVLDRRDKRGTYQRVENHPFSAGEAGGQGDEDSMLYPATGMTAVTPVAMVAMTTVGLGIWIGLFLRTSALAAYRQ